MAITPSHGNPAATRISLREGDIHPLPMDKGTDPTMDLCWVFCWHRLEELHAGLFDPTWSSGFVQQTFLI